MADGVNVPNIYDPIFYAQNAILELEKALGMANRVYRGFDRNPQERGSTIQIRRPSTFTAVDAPATEAAAITTSTISMTLDKWKEVKFGLTDKELTLDIPQIVTEHIRPAAYALADCIDQDLCGLYKDIPWFTGTAATTPDGIEDLTNCYQALFDNKVPMGDPAMLHLMIDGAAQNKFQQLAAFNQVAGAGDLALQTQLRGTLGVKFGFEIFANQNVKTHTAGTCDDVSLQLKGKHLIYATTVTLEDVEGSVTGTLKAGDSFVIAGNTQRYSVTADATASGNEFANLAITPPLVQEYADHALVTVTLQAGVRNVAFHRDAFALAMAPLSEMGDGLGARIATVTDPITGISLRSRVWYVGGSSKVYVGLDCLYGIKTLDPNKAVCLLG